MRGGIVTQFFLLWLIRTALPARTDRHGIPHQVKRLGNTRLTPESGGRLAKNCNRLPMAVGTNSSLEPTNSKHARGSCRLCAKPLETTFINLGMSPLCESILTADQLDQMEPYYPLHVFVCSACFLVQLQE